MKLEFETSPPCLKVSGPVPILDTIREYIHNLQRVCHLLHLLLILLNEILQELISVDFSLPIGASLSSTLLKDLSRRTGLYIEPQPDTESKVRQDPISSTNATHDHAYR